MDEALRKQIRETIAGLKSGALLVAHRDSEWWADVADDLWTTLSDTEVHIQQLASAVQEYRLLGDKAAWDKLCTLADGVQYFAEVRNQTLK